LCCNAKRDSKAQAGHERVEHAEVAKGEKEGGMMNVKADRVREERSQESCGEKPRQRESQGRQVEAKEDTQHHRQVDVESAHTKNCDDTKRVETPGFATTLAQAVGEIILCTG
jgi:hypothetical protein